MKILEDMSIEEVRRHAEKPTPEPISGEWTLTAPDGRQWKGDRPTECLIAEGNDRVPALIQLARIRLSIEEPDPEEARLAAAEQMAQALSQMLTHMGMDEDEWNAKTFSDARASLAAWEAAT